MVATRGTARVLQAMGIPTKVVPKVGEGRPDCVDVIVQGKINLVVNTPSAGGEGHHEPAFPLPNSAPVRGGLLSLAGTAQRGAAHPRGGAGFITCRT